MTYQSTSKRKQYFYLHFAFLLLLPLLSQSQNILINEFMASNSNTIADANGGFDDWVELYNPGSSPIDISGYYVSDDASNQNKRQLPNNPGVLTIPANGYLLLWFDAEPQQGADHVDLKLGAGGEDIVLVANDGTTVIDSYTFGQQSANISEGRTPNGGANWGFFVEASPGASNGTPSGSGQALTPIASIQGGLYNNNLSVTLNTATPGATIHYTTDGSVPGASSPLYNGPISISEITPLRAIALGSGLLPSKVMTESYLVNVAHDFAIIALNTEPDFLFDAQLGIFGNPGGGNEHPAHVQFFEPDGTLGFSQDIEIEIHGTATLSLGQKSLKLKARSSLGAEFFDYPIFPDLPYDKYRSVLIRQSGQDWRKSNFRDAMMQSLAGDLTDLGDLVAKPDLDLQGYRPSVVYINGEYWGIYNIREQVNWKYVDTHYGLDEDEIYVAERNSGGVEGDPSDEAAYSEFDNFLENNDFASEVDFEGLKKKLEVSHFLDHMIHGIYTDNNDWPGNNSKFWRPKAADGKWRFFTKDMDFGFGLRPINADWNSGDFTTDMISITLDDNSSEYYNPPSSTLLFRKVMENENTRRDFFNRSADLLNTLFSSSRVVARIDAFENRYTPEYQAHLDRWNGGWNQHAEEVNILRTFASGREEAVREHIVDYFSEVDGLTQVTLNANPTSGGQLLFSTLQLSETHFPWTGTYFRGIDIPVLAKVNRGYVLASWSDNSLGNDLEVVVNYNSSTNNLTANFEFGSTATDPIVINEINYNSPDFPNAGDWIELFNPNSTAVDISGWYFEDSSGDFFGLPANTIMEAGAYLLIAEDLAQFKLVYPSASNVYGGFGDDPAGFKLSNGGELLTLKNANGVLIDNVAYDDNSPWATAPDGNGPTLQLTNPSLDNSIAGSWMSFLATPGSLNGVIPETQDQVIFFPPISDQFTFASPLAPGATASSGLPVTYNIIAGPAVILNNTIVLNGSTGTVIVEANQPGNASYHPATAIQQLFLVKAFDNPAEGYCESKGSAPWQEWISNVSFASIDHDSGKDRYGDFSNIGTYVMQGQTVPISIKPDYSWQPYDDYFRVWIDYNQDGDFYDAGEMVLSAIEENGNTVVENITIPQTATLGITRMRIAMQRDQYADPCDLFDFGEVEDYTIIIEESSGANTGLLSLDCVDNIILTAPVGASSMSVAWIDPTVSTTCPNGGAIVNLSPNSIPNGGDFPIGTSTVLYQAFDGCDNLASCSFTVTVNANNGVLNITCPDDIEVTAASGANSASVGWALPSTNTTCTTGGVSLSLVGGSIPNGGVFPLGNSTVSYEATDACGNTAVCSFNVIVNGQNNNTLTVDCPSDIFVSIPEGQNSVEATWVLPMVESSCSSGGGGNSNCGQDLSGFDFVGTYNGHEYYISEEQERWDEGQAAAAQFGATLAIISDEEENDFIHDNINKSAFIGLTDQVNETEFVWEDGSPTTYTNFALSSSNTSTRDFVKFQSSNGEWKVHSANYNRYYLMELDCVGGSSNTTLTQTAGPQNGDDLSEGTYTVTYLASDDCGDEVSCSFTITVTQEEGGGDYCESEGEEPWNQHIDIVEFHTLYNDSGKDGYGDFTDLNTSVVMGNTYDFSLTPKFSWSYWDEYVRVWIDFNQDADFNDPGEMVLETISVAGTPNYPPTVVDVIDNSITIPTGVSSGATRMRVSMQKEAFAGPCDAFTFGEVEDYTVVIASSFNLVGATNFLQFDAEKAGRQVNLNWTANAEIETDYFILERSVDGSHFEEIEKIANLSGDFEKHYEAEDQKPFEGVNYYRLKEVFVGGTHRFAEVKEVFFDLALNEFTVFPVPTDGMLYVALKKSAEQRNKDITKRLSVYDCYGRLMLERGIDTEIAELVTLDLSEFTAGIYMVVLEEEGRKQVVRKVVLE